jgi:hypothetical protein
VLQRILSILLGLHRPVVQCARRDHQTASGQWGMQVSAVSLRATTTTIDQCWHKSGSVVALFVQQTSNRACYNPLAPAATNRSESLQRPSTAAESKNAQAVWIMAQVYVTTTRVPRAECHIDTQGSVYQNRRVLDTDHYSGQCTIVSHALLVASTSSHANILNDSPNAQRRRKGPVN